MGQVQVGAAIGASFRYIGEAWSKAWGVMLILVWFTAALEAIQLLKPGWTLVSFLGLIATLFVTTAASGALFRLGLTGDHPGDPAFAPGPAGFNWGALEWRVMGANILVGIIVGVLVVVAIIVWAIAVGATAGVSGGADVQALEQGASSDRMAAFTRLLLGPAGLAAVIVGVPALTGLVWLSAKLALVTPLAADTRAFDFGKAWTLTRGGVLALIAASLLIFLLEVVLALVAGGAAGIIAALTQNSGLGKIWGGIAGQAADAAINTPLFVGLVLYVYRTQRGDAGVAATFS
jgi:hypothetical protein